VTLVGNVALVLHGHLPYALHTAGQDRLALRWLLEAIWECYLPLCQMLDRLEADKLPGAISWSLSPSLVSMLSDPRVPATMAEHLDALYELNAAQARRLASEPAFEPVLAHYRDRIDSARSYWQASGGHLLGVLRRHQASGRLELMTTSVTHAYLPGLSRFPGAVRAQLRLGQLSFERLCGLRPVGLWLPECGYDDTVGEELGRAQVGYTVLDAHGLERARPRPRDGADRPVLGSSGVAFFARDPSVSRQVWSSAQGYPGDPAYREFYRDLGLELDPAALGALGAGLMTGLKYWRIGPRGQRKEPYDPTAALARVQVHAAHFVELCRQRLASASPGSSPSVLVAAYDAELFGHWWHEGPAFLEQVLRLLSRTADLGALRLGDVLRRHPRCSVVQPASSSWGEGGFAAPWVGPRSAFVWRHVHEVHRRVEHALAVGRQLDGRRGAALDQAIRELLLLEASDWPFMIHGQALARYGHERVELHAGRALRLLDACLAEPMSESELGWGEQVQRQSRFLRELGSEELRGAFDP